MNFTSRKIKIWCVGLSSAPSNATRNLALPFHEIVLLCPCRVWRIWMLSPVNEGDSDMCGILKVFPVWLVGIYLVTGIIDGIWNSFERTTVGG